MKNLMTNTNRRKNWWKQRAISGVGGSIADNWGTNLKVGNTKTRSVPMVDIRPRTLDKPYEYNYNFSASYGNGFKNINKNFKTRKEAIKYAKRFMKLHPRGW
jgi:hypothetical protein